MSDECTEEMRKNRVPVEFYNTALSVLELVMMKKNIVSVPGVFLNSDDINMCISVVCSGF